MALALGVCQNAQYPDVRAIEEALRPEDGEPNRDRALRERRLALVAELQQEIYHFDFSYVRKPNSYLIEFVDVLQIDFGILSGFIAELQGAGPFGGLVSAAARRTIYRKRSLRDEIARTLDSLRAKREKLGLIRRLVVESDEFRRQLRVMPR